MLEVVAHIWLKQHQYRLHHFDAMDQMARSTMQNVIDMPSYGGAWPL